LKPLAELYMSLKFTADKIDGQRITRVIVEIPAEDDHNKTIE